MSNTPDKETRRKKHEEVNDLLQRLDRLPPVDSKIVAALRNEKATILRRLYGSFGEPDVALRMVDDVLHKSVIFTAGPPGCGKSTGMGSAFHIAQQIEPRRTLRLQTHDRDIAVLKDLFGMLSGNFSPPHWKGNHSRFHKSTLNSGG